MKNKIILLLIIFLGLVGFLLLNSIVDRVFFVLFIVSLFIVSKSLGFYKLLLVESISLLLFSVLIYLVNSPLGNFTYYYEKTSLWAFYFFVVGIILMIIETVKNE
jgi:hypothetical protein